MMPPLPPCVRRFCVGCLEQQQHGGAVVCPLCRETHPASTPRRGSKASTLPGGGGSVPGGGHGHDPGGSGGPGPRGPRPRGSDTSTLRGSDDALSISGSSVTDHVTSERHDRTPEAMRRPEVVLGPRFMAKAYSLGGIAASSPQILTFHTSGREPEVAQRGRYGNTATFHGYPGRRFPGMPVLGTQLRSFNTLNNLRKPNKNFVFLGDIDLQESSTDHDRARPVRAETGSSIRETDSSLLHTGSSILQTGSDLEETGSSVINTERKFRKFESRPGSGNDHVITRVSGAQMFVREVSADPDYRRCGICFEPYEPEDGPRRFVILPCLHRMCAGCLQRLLRDTPSAVQCPYCRQTHEDLPEMESRGSSEHLSFKTEDTDPGNTGNPGDFPGSPGDYDWTLIHQIASEALGLRAQPDPNPPPYSHPVPAQIHVETHVTVPRDTLNPFRRRGNQSDRNTATFACLGILVACAIMGALIWVINYRNTD